MKHATLEQKIESYLFYEGGSASFKNLVHVTDASLEDVRAAVLILEKHYAERGVVFVLTESEVSMRVAPSCSSFIEKLHKESQAKEIGPASLEVLGILLYRGKSSQAEIDTIRGVNSAFSLRNLRMRGLVQRLSEGANQKYEITPEALSHLGVTNSNDIPNREAVLASLASFEAQSSEISAEATFEGEEAE